MINLLIIFHYFYHFLPNDKVFNLRNKGIGGTLLKKSDQPDSFHRLQGISTDADSTVKREKKSEFIFNRLVNETDHIMLFRSTMMSGKTSFSTLFEDYVLDNHKDFIPIRLTCTTFKSNGSRFENFWFDLMGYEFSVITDRTSKQINEKELVKVILIIDEAQILYGFQNDIIWSTVKNIQLKNNNNLFIMLFGIYGNFFYSSSSNKTSSNSSEIQIITPDHVNISDCFSLSFFLFDKCEFEYLINYLCKKHKISENENEKEDFSNYIKNKIGSHPGILKLVDIFLNKYYVSENSKNEIIKIKELIDSNDFEKEVKNARCCHYFEKVLYDNDYKAIIQRFLNGDKNLNLNDNHYLLKAGIFSKDIENKNTDIYTFPSPLFESIFKKIISGIL